MKKLSIVLFSSLLLGCGISDAEFEKQINDARKRRDFTTLDELLATDQGVAYKKRSQEKNEALGAAGLRDSTRGKQIEDSLVIDSDKKGF